MIFDIFIILVCTWLLLIWSICWFKRCKKWILWVFLTYFIFPAWALIFHWYVLWFIIFAEYFRKIILVRSDWWIFLIFYFIYIIIYNIWIQLRNKILILLIFLYFTFYKWWTVQILYYIIFEFFIIKIIWV